MLDELHFHACISRNTTCASTTSPRTIAYIQSSASILIIHAKPYSRRQRDTSTSTITPTCLPSHAQSLLPGRDARDGITIRKGAMLTISLVNDILARLQQEHEACKATVKHEGQHHQRMYVTKNKRELHAQ